MIRRPALLSLLPLALAAAQPTQATRPAAPARAKAVDRARMDLSTPPCKDFVRYASGRWMDKAEIPGDKSMTGVDQELEQRNDALLKAILEESAKGVDPKDPLAALRQKVGDFYASGMDEKRIEQTSRWVLQPELAKISNVTDAKSLAAELARLHSLFGGYAAPGFLAYVSVDDKDSSRYVLALRQGGLGLPDRDYYLKDDAPSKDLRDAYLAHVARTFALAGDPDDAAAARAKAVLDFETRLAKAAKPRVELRDPQGNYHLMDLAQLQQTAPGFDWAAYFAALGKAQPGPLNVQQPAFMTELGLMAGQADLLADWRSYLRWQLLRSASPYLGKELEDEAFAFYGTRLRGTPEPLPRWKRVEQATDRALGEALGQLFVQKAFPPEAKARALELVKNIVAALRQRIGELDWMSAPTKVEALRKLDTLRIKIGYPDQWRDYAKLEIKRRPFVLNVMAAAQFERARQLAKLGGPVDHNEWTMTPPTINAYYEPTLNEIAFPAGILQPPYFDPEADDAVNYGAIGAVIGHEITHGFDDEGRQYDALGNLKDWWTPQDAKAYAAKAALVVKQFDAFEPLPGLHVNGQLTLGENIADLGGLKIAYLAWKKATAAKKLEPIDGFTPEQRFFLAYAESWRTKMRPEALRLQVTTNEHAPALYRVLGPVADLPEFQRAFGCADADPMVQPAAQRPAIW